MPVDIWACALFYMMQEFHEMAMTCRYGILTNDGLAHYLFVRIFVRIILSFF